MESFKLILEKHNEEEFSFSLDIDEPDSGDWASVAHGLVSAMLEDTDFAATLLLSAKKFNEIMNSPSIPKA